MPTEQNRNEQLRSQLLKVLDNLFTEDDFCRPVDSEKLCELLSVSRQELELIIGPLLAGEWVKKMGQTLSGLFRLRLTTYGKEQYDRVMGETSNESLRERILASLAEEYEKNVHAITNCTKLASTLEVSPNQIDFNLKILEEHGFVRLYEEGPPYHASLTASGKTALDNPEPKVLFVSHASIDKEIADYLKGVINESFPQVDVFVSTDPEDLQPGDRWVEIILRKLADARMLLVLATERGLGRKWVWFETGAGWAKQLRLVPCCLGKVGKGSLPAPFSDYQALNLGDEDDFGILVDILGKEFGTSSSVPDYRTTTQDLIRLDVRAEEKESLARARPYTSAMNAQVESGLRKLNEAEKEAIRLLYVEDEVTGRRALQVLVQKGLLKGNEGSVFQRIAHETNFVQRIWPYHDSERVYGYTGPWRVNPHLKGILESYLFEAK